MNLLDENRDKNMSPSWKSTTLTSVDQILEILLELLAKRWLCRGQSGRYKSLIPSMDRKPRQDLSRAKKLEFERQSINIFRSTTKFFSGRGEEGALTDDVIALMVLRHYGVPTRLLDWSRSPYVAAYFAACDSEKEDGDIWSFDEPLYEQKGKEQWRKWPETTRDRSGDPDKFEAGLTMFSLKEPPDWFICGFYPSGFPRQNAQRGVYTMTARFGRDHAEAITKLLADNSRHLYVVPAKLKPELLQHLRDNHGIWRGSLFPDSAGAAGTAHTVFPSDGV